MTNSNNFDDGGNFNDQQRAFANIQLYDIDAFICFWDTKTCKLDGDFTIPELERIINVLRNLESITALCTRIMDGTASSSTNRSRGRRKGFLRHA